MATSINLIEAIAYFEEVDPVMAAVIQQVHSTSPSLVIPQSKSPAAYFPILVQSIVSQQISTKAAASIWSRLKTAITVTPTSIIASDDAGLRKIGLSKQKVRYIRLLAEQWPALESHAFSSLSDAEIQKRLCRCYGVGVWTAQMFLLFAMARPDIFAVGDLALRQKVATIYGLTVADTAAIKKLSDRWSPHRSAVSLSLWHKLDNGPVPF